MTNIRILNVRDNQNMLFRYARLLFEIKDLYHRASLTLTII